MSSFIKKTEGKITISIISIVVAIIIAIALFFAFRKKDNKKDTGKQEDNNKNNNSNSNNKYINNKENKNNNNNNKNMNNNNKNNNNNTNNKINKINNKPQIINNKVNEMLPISNVAPSIQTENHLPNNNIPVKLFDNINNVNNSHTNEENEPVNEEHEEENEENKEENEPVNNEENNEENEQAKEENKDNEESNEENKEEEKKEENKEEEKKNEEDEDNKMWYYFLYFFQNVAEGILDQNDAFSSIKNILKSFNREYDNCVFKIKIIKDSSVIELYNDPLTILSLNKELACDQKMVSAKDISSFKLSNSNGAVKYIMDKLEKKYKHEQLFNLPFSKFIATKIGVYNQKTKYIDLFFTLTCK